MVDPTYTAEQQGSKASHRSAHERAVEEGAREDTHNRGPAIEDLRSLLSWLPWIGGRD